MKYIKKWFTLVEVVIWVTIFSMIMISVMSIYILASDTSLKSDINRAMHENIKNVFTDVSENIINNWIEWVSSNIIDFSCDFSLWSDNHKRWNKLCVWSDEYYLSKYNWSNYTRVYNADCSDISDQCYIVKNWIPITNSLVSVKKLEFIVTNTYSKKTTIIISLMPTIKAWVKPSQIENNILNFQTTVNNRPF